MKAIIMLVLISLIVWSGWMSWQWLRNPKKENFKNNKNKK